MNKKHILANISENTFLDIISLSPRKVRESLYSHYGIKSQTKTAAASIKNKQENRARLLHQKLLSASSKKELDLCQELIRNWLFHQRPLLKSTLDFLEVENDNGLVEVETDFFKELDEATVDNLLKHLTKQFHQDHIKIYLTFMEVPHLEKHFN